ncbi:MAG: hypothetical protein ACP5VQ_03545 [Phycisphaerae bacterium]
MRNIHIIGFFGMVLAAGLAGCSQNSASLLAPVPNPPVADIPIPQGMHIDLSRSQSTYAPGSNIRLVNELYTGSDPRMSVARFFLHNMPTYKWKLLEERQGPGGISLNFLKNQEECLITIKRGWFNTHCYVSVTPALSKGATTAPSTQP